MISRYGVQAMASSFDQVGIMTKTVEDAEILLRAVAGQDTHDAQSSDRANQRKESFDQCGARKNINLKTLKIAIPEESLGEGLDSRVRAIFDEKVEALKHAGAKIEIISLPILKQALAIYYTLMPAEVSTNLARFDGIRFGLQDNTLNHDSLMKYYTHVRSQGFGDEAKRRILL
jgi:aspartyl-tRNA(Asn)/glutamyl-tRNA(Gln) amidotransferase subunit A